MQPPAVEVVDPGRVETDLRIALDVKEVGRAPQVLVAHGLVRVDRGRLDHSRRQRVPDPISSIPSNSRKQPFTVASIMCFTANATLERGASTDHLPAGDAARAARPSTTDIQKLPDRVTMLDGRESLPPRSTRSGEGPGAPLPTDFNASH